MPNQHENKNSFAEMGAGPFVSALMHPSVILQKSLDADNVLCLRKRATLPAQIGRARRAQLTTRPAPEHLDRVQVVRPGRYVPRMDVPRRDKPDTSRIFLG